MLKCCMMAVSSLMFMVNMCSPGSVEGEYAESALMVDAAIEDKAVLQTVDQEGPEIKTVSHKQMLIKRAEIRMEVESLHESYGLLKKYLSATHAYYSGENQQFYGGSVEREFEIRVPVSEFDSLMYLISSMGVKIDYRNISSKDVTEEYLDLQARIKTQKALEARYQQLLNRAKTIEDILKLEKYLTEVREKIERMQGRTVYLRDKASYSSVKLSMYEAGEAITVKQTSTFWTEVKRSFINGWKGLTSVLIAIINMWPLLLFAGLGYWAYRRWKSRLFPASKDNQTKA
ncbi:MAG: DUF4349 domain-containing protein [Bacteroidota bacterium]